MSRPALRKETWADDMCSAQLGLVRLAAFMLQSLTAERKLASRLNGPVDLKPSLRGKYSVPGTLGDFLIVRTTSPPWI